MGHDARFLAEEFCSLLVCESRLPQEVASSMSESSEERARPRWAYVREFGPYRKKDQWPVGRKEGKESVLRARVVFAWAVTEVCSAGRYRSKN